MSFSYAYSDDASEELDREDASLIKSFPLHTKDGSKPPDLKEMLKVDTDSLVVDDLGEEDKRE